MSEHEQIQLLYPDIMEDGGLLSVIRKMFVMKGAQIQVNGFGAGKGYVHVQAGKRSSQIFLRLDKRCFLLDFWVDEKKQADGSAKDLSQVKDAIEQWLSEETHLETFLGEFPFVCRYKKVIPHNN